MTTFAFEPGRPAGTDLSNWREAPQNRWSFRHARELVPSARIRAAARMGREPDAPGDALNALNALNVEMPGGGRGDLAALLTATRADELLVWKSGRPACHWTAPGSDPVEPHLLFSVSKSITALLAGILEGQGRLDPQAPVTTYVPELAASSAYG
ncbi:MAG TPA: serine hydrolase, partial [Methylobacterium sp.]